MLQRAARQAFIVNATAATSAVWLVTLVLAPWLAHRLDWVAALPYAVGALICHQRPERSFHLAGAQLPVCARCLGLYAGAAAGLVWWAARARNRTTPWPRASAVAALVITGMPTAFTVATAWLGVLDPPNAWRSALALPLGVTGGRVLGAAITNHLK